MEAIMGRPGKPWQRDGKGPWYQKIRGRVVNLGNTIEERDANLARLLAGEVAAAVRAEISPPAGTQRVREGTVASLVPMFLKAIDIEPKTRKDYADRLAWLVRGWGGVGVADLDAEDLEAAARSAGWTANTRRQTLAIAQSFVRWCRRWDFTLKWPPAESRGDEAILTPAEYARLLAASTGDFRQLVIFVRAVGCRQGEACKLTAEIVAGCDGVVVLKQHKTAKKTGRKRNLYLNATARRVLAEQVAKYHTGPLFRGGRGVRFTSKRAGVVFAEAAKKAGLGEGRTLNCLRHTWATDALERGVSDSDVATLLGHTGTGMLHRHYQHLTANARRLADVADRLDAAG
jgi:integrase